VKFCLQAAWATEAEIANARVVIKARRMTFSDLCQPSA